VLDELVAAAVAHPEDDGPRLVLADALIQRGDPWGELITASCAHGPYWRGELPTDERSEALFRRCRELAEAHFDIAGAAHHFVRGFCTEVSFRGAPAMPPDHRAYAMLERIEVREPTRELLEQLAAWPPLARVRRLHLEEPPEGVPLAPLVERARGLRALALRRAGVGRGELTRLLAIPRVAADLRELALAGNYALAGELRGVAWPRLERLDLSGCGLGTGDVVQLRVSRALAELRALELGHNDLDAAVADALTGWELEELDVAGCQLGAEAISRIASDPHRARLARLAIGNDHEDLEPALPAIGALPRLVELTLRTQRRVRNLQAIARPYRKLALQLRELDVRELRALLADPQLADLRQLRLDRGNTGDGTQLAMAITAAPRDRLEVLAFEKCRLGEAGAQVLARSRALPDRLSLIIGGDRLGAGETLLRERFRRLTVYATGRAGAR
jgi:uncharacterized protein (TIGR02996 family)